MDDKEKKDNWTLLLAKMNELNIDQAEQDFIR
jgi:hypothetical protein